eukprot:TRINITY_DN43441_c0_g1_i1.p1 TRINITY_DN43441_c0_g1~~TRINITY_DN43441_c0_g1_i1.p1  ORF type:complete len:679 (+),score=120.87 TRINITY_DN43441_c0_g1_i1:126-2162(+)
MSWWWSSKMEPTTAPAPPGPRDASSERFRDRYAKSEVFSDRGKRHYAGGANPGSQPNPLNTISEDARSPSRAHRAAMSPPPYTSAMGAANRSLSPRAAQDAGGLSPRTPAAGGFSPRATGPALHPAGPLPNLFLAAPGQWSPCRSRPTSPSASFCASPRGCLSPRRRCSPERLIASATAQMLRESSTCISSVSSEASTAASRSFGTMPVHRHMQRHSVRELLQDSTPCSADGFCSPQRGGLSLTSQTGWTGRRAARVRNSSPGISGLFGADEADSEAPCEADLAWRERKTSPRARVQGLSERRNGSELVQQAVQDEDVQGHACTVRRRGPPSTGWAAVEQDSSGGVGRLIREDRNATPLAADAALPSRSVLEPRWPCRSGSPGAEANGSSEVGWALQPPTAPGQMAAAKRASLAVASLREAQLRMRDAGPIVDFSASGVGQGPGGTIAPARGYVASMNACSSSSSCKPSGCSVSLPSRTRSPDASLLRAPLPLGKTKEEVLLQECKMQVAAAVSAVMASRPMPLVSGGLVKAESWQPQVARPLHETHPEVAWPQPMQPAPVPRSSSLKAKLPSKVGAPIRILPADKSAVASAAAGRSPSRTPVVATTAHVAVQPVEAAMAPVIVKPLVAPPPQAALPPRLDGQQSQAQAAPVPLTSAPEKGEKKRKKSESPNRHLGGA